MSRRLIRVFPRRTKATPNDALARFNVPDLYDEADEVHVSVTFHDHDASGRRGPWPDLSGEGVSAGGGSHQATAQAGRLIPGRTMTRASTG